MKRILIAACMSGLLISGCSTAGQEASDSSGTPSPTETSETVTETPEDAAVDQAAVDEALDNFIAGTLIFNQLDGDSLDEILVQFREARAAWAAVGDVLQGGVEGVPQSTTDEVLNALETSLAAVDDLIACFESTTTTSCEAEGDTSADAARTLGEVTAALVPYGTRSEDEFLAALQVAPDSSDSNTATETVSQSNAREKAQQYLDFSGFSRQGLIEQLEFEGFSRADATYGADAVGADWNEQAARKAQSYLDFSSFSRSGLIEQLEFEGFTRSEATYGADAVGL